MDIYTSFYSSGHLRPEHAAIKTSLGHPRFRLSYKIAGKIPELTPERPWLGLSREKYQPLYLAKLEAAGVDVIRRAIETVAGGRVPVLLCFEHLTDGTWCHRRMFSEWWRRKTGQEVPEL